MNQNKNIKSAFTGKRDIDLTSNYQSGSPYIAFFQAASYHDDHQWLQEDRKTKRLEYSEKVKIIFWSVKSEPGEAEETGL